MRVTSVAVAIVVAIPLFLGTQIRPQCGSACQERPARPSQLPRLLLALDERNGKVLWRAKPRGPDGGHVDAKFVTHGLLIAEEFRCGSGDRAPERGDVSLVAFDER